MSWIFKERDELRKKISAEDPEVKAAWNLTHVHKSELFGLFKESNNVDFDKFMNLESVKRSEEIARDIMAHIDARINKILKEKYGIESIDPGYHLVFAKSKVPYLSEDDRINTEMYNFIKRTAQQHFPDEQFQEIDIRQIELEAEKKTELWKRVGINLPLYLDGLPRAYVTIDNTGDTTGDTNRSYYKGTGITSNIDFVRVALGAGVASFDFRFGPNWFNYLCREENFKATEFFDTIVLALYGIKK